MKIRVDYTWYRDHYNQDPVNNFVIIPDVEPSKRGVTQAIRAWVKGWSGRGFVDVSDISTTYMDDQKFCEIAQRRFRFNS